MEEIVVRFYSNCKRIFGLHLKPYCCKTYKINHQTIALCSNVLYFGGTKIIQQVGDVEGREGVRMIFGNKYQ